MKIAIINRLFIDKSSRKFKYQKETYKFIRIETNDILLKIITDKKTITIFQKDFEENDIEWLEEVTNEPNFPTPNKYTSKPTDVMLMNSNSLITNKGIQIADILMENITRVRSDKDYVPQAEAINSSVKAFIDLAKVEVEMIKASRA